ncbi:hypothetical protein FOZ62_020792, partial [Perkinsus olseni]
MLVEALRQEIHQANAKHLILVSEIALSASHLSTVSEDRDVAVNEARALRAALEEVELELSTTKMRSAIGHRRLAHIRQFVSMSKQPLLK